MSNFINDTLFILAAGGSSSRYGDGNKLLAILHGMPVFLHSVRTAASVFGPDAILMSIPASEEEAFRTLARQYLPEVNIRFAHGGANRTESVLNALEAGQRLGYRFAAIHDAGRPLVSAGHLQKLHEAVLATGGAILCRPMNETVKQVAADGKSIITIPRDTLRIAETPQVFDYAELLKHTRVALASGKSFTDDAQVMETYSSIPVSLVVHTGCNIKITYRDDLDFCEQYLSAQQPAK